MRLFNNSEDESAPLPFYPYLLPLGLLLLEPLFSWSLGLSHWALGKSLDLISVILRLAFFVIGIHVLLVGPIVQFAYPEIAKLRTRPFRLFFLFLLLFPPLFSFGYYLGNVKHESGYFELLWDLFPLVLASVVLYEKTRRLSLLSLALSIGCYFHFFVVGGIVGPFKTMFQWVPSGDSLNLYRVVYGTVVLGLAFSLESTAKPSVTQQTRERGISFLFLMAAGLVFQFVLPIFLTSQATQRGILDVLSESLYLIFPVLVLLSLNRSSLGQKIYGYTLYLGLFAYSWAFTTRVLSNDNGLWNCAWVGLIGLGLVTILLTCVRRKSFWGREKTEAHSLSSTMRHASQ